MTMAAPLPTVADKLPLGASPNLTEGDGGGSTEIQCENISNESPNEPRVRHAGVSPPFRTKKVIYILRQKL